MNANITESTILDSMRNESTFDTIVEDSTMPEDVYNAIKHAQRNWQNWLSAKAVELNIDPAKVKAVRKY